MIVLDCVSKAVYYYDSLGRFSQDILLTVMRWWRTFEQDGLLHQAIAEAVRADGNRGDAGLVEAVRKIERDTAYSGGEHGSPSIRYTPPDVEKDRRTVEVCCLLRLACIEFCPPSSVIEAEAIDEYLVCCISTPDQTCDPLNGRQTPT